MNQSPVSNQSVTTTINITKFRKRFIVRNDPVVLSSVHTWICKASWKAPRYPQPSEEILTWCEHTGNPTIRLPEYHLQCAVHELPCTWGSVGDSHAQVWAKRLHLRGCRGSPRKGLPSLVECNRMLLGFRITLHHMC